MKALSFLDMTLFLNSDNDKKEQFELIKIMEHFGFSGIVPFYAQPFKPEQITEYFEGWVRKFETTYTCEDVLVGFDMDAYCIAKKMQSGKWYSLPRTLDEFITDCQRAGIELHWRVKESINHYNPRAARWDYQS